MSEQATETVVVHDANTARALIGRSIWGVQITDQMGDDGSFALLSDDTPLATGTYGDPHGVEVDALPPATEWVHLDDVKDRKLPGETEPVYGVGTREGEWQWWPTGGGERRPLTVVDHMVEVLAETPPEPDTVSVELPRDVAEWARDGDWLSPEGKSLRHVCRAALAAEGGEG